MSRRAPKTSDLDTSRTSAGRGYSVAISILLDSGRWAPDAVGATGSLQASCSRPLRLRQRTHRARCTASTKVTTDERQTSSLVRRRSSVCAGAENEGAGGEAYGTEVNQRTRK